MLDDVLISPDQAREYLTNDAARLLVVGKEAPSGALPSGALPSGASFAEARDFRDGPARGVAGPAALERLCARCGIAEDTPVVLASVAANQPHAALALWTLALYGHEPLALLDGGRPAWEDGDASARDGEPPEPAGYLPGPSRFGAFRATRDDVQRHLDDGTATLLDVRSPAEFSGTYTAPSDAPQEGILRGGHLPGALNVPWSRALRSNGALRPSGLFRPRGELEMLYCEEHSLDPSVPIFVYSRTAARACHTWFVLTRLLGFEAVRVYDGGWAEWGNLVAAPVVRGKPT